jgi:hypothetical protein
VQLLRLVAAGHDPALTEALQASLNQSLRLPRQGMLVVSQMCGGMRARVLMLILPFLAACRSVCAPQAVQATGPC